MGNTERANYDRRRNVIDMEVNVATRRLTIITSMTSTLRTIIDALTNLQLDGYETHTERCSVGVALTIVGGRWDRVEARRVAVAVRDCMATAGLRLRICPF